MIHYIHPSRATVSLHINKLQSMWAHARRTIVNNWFAATPRILHHATRFSNNIFKSINLVDCINYIILHLHTRSTPYCEAVTFAARQIETRGAIYRATRFFLLCILSSGTTYLVARSFVVDSQIVKIANMINIFTRSSRRISSGQVDVWHRKYFVNVVASGAICVVYRLKDACCGLLIALH